jgi:hypothetical protein
MQTWNIQLKTDGTPSLIFAQEVAFVGLGPDSVELTVTYTGHNPLRLTVAERVGPPAEMDLLSPRSGKWSTVRKHHLEKNPTCAACGGTTLLNVHHIQPFHIHPELELDPTNLITLCEDPMKLCHCAVGHAFDWKSYVPTVVEDAAYLLKRRQGRIQGKPGDPSI